MNALWQIILAILWRLRPVQALEVNLHDVIQMGFALFTDEQDLDDLANDPKRRAILAAALFDAHRKLDLLIYLRACELTGERPRITSFKPNYSHTHSSANLTALWRSFQRLVAKFDDYERLAKRRAQTLRRDANDYPLRLAASLQSTSPSLRLVEAIWTMNTRRRLASISPKDWGRWIGASSRRDGLARRSAAQAAGGCALARGSAFARGPPATPNSPFPTPHLAATCEIAPARPTASPE